MAVKDQFNDDEVGGGGNMTFKTTSMSPKHGTSIRAVSWRDSGPDSDCDNNGYPEHLNMRLERERGPTG